MCSLFFYGITLYTITSKEHLSIQDQRTFFHSTEISSALQGKPFTNLHSISLKVKLLVLQNQLICIDEPSSRVQMTPKSKRQLTSYHISLTLVWSVSLLLWESKTQKATVSYICTNGPAQVVLTQASCLPMSPGPCLHAKPFHFITRPLCGVY